MSSWEIRFNEAAAASQIIGAQHFSIGIPDIHVTADNDQLIYDLGRVMRKTQPELIITHFEKDYMNDHMQTYYWPSAPHSAPVSPHFHCADAGPAFPSVPFIIWIQWQGSVLFPQSMWTSRMK